MLDLRAVRRETTSTSTAASPFAVTIASFRAGHDVDLVVHDTLDEPGATDPDARRWSATFTPRHELHARRSVPDPAAGPERHRARGCPEYDRHFRPDTGDAYTNLGAFTTSGATPSTIDSAYTVHRRPRRHATSRSSTSATPSSGFDTTISFTATTDVDATLTDLDTAQSLVDRSGRRRQDRHDDERLHHRSPSDTGDLRVGRHHLDGVRRHAHLARPDPRRRERRGRARHRPDPTDVTGVNITMTAGTAGVHRRHRPARRTSSRSTSTARRHRRPRRAATASRASPASSPAAPRPPDDERHLPHRDDGDLRLDTVTTKADVALVTLAGSIVDARNGGAGDDAANVIGNSIDLDANGTGASIGDPTGTNDLEIDSSSRLARPATSASRPAASIYVTETDGTLHLVLAEALTGDIRITVRETIRHDAVRVDLDEDLDLLARRRGPVRRERAHAHDPERPRSRALARLRPPARSATTSTTTSNSEILAGDDIDIYGDYDERRRRTSARRWCCAARSSPTASSPAPAATRSPPRAATTYLTADLGPHRRRHLPVRRRDRRRRRRRRVDSAGYIFLGSQDAGRTAARTSRRPTATTARTASSSTTCRR